MWWHTHTQYCREPNNLVLHKKMPFQIHILPLFWLVHLWSVYCLLSMPVDNLKTPGHYNLCAYYLDMLKPQKGPQPVGLFFFDNWCLPELCRWWEHRWMSALTQTSPSNKTWRTSLSMSSLLGDNAMIVDSQRYSVFKQPHVLMDFISYWGGHLAV